MSEQVGRQEGTQQESRGAGEDTCLRKNLYCSSSVSEKFYLQDKPGMNKAICQAAPESISQVWLRQKSSVTAWVRLVAWSAPTQLRFTGFVSLLSVFPPPQKAFMAKVQVYSWCWEVYITVTLTSRYLRTGANLFVMNSHQGDPRAQI